MRGLLVALLVRIDIAEQDLRVDAVGLDLQCRLEQGFGLVKAFGTPIGLHGHAGQFHVGGIELRVLGDQPLQRVSCLAHCVSFAGVDQRDGLVEDLVGRLATPLPLGHPGLEVGPRDGLRGFLADDRLAGLLHPHHDLRGGAAAGVSGMLQFEADLVRTALGCLEVQRESVGGCAGALGTGGLAF